MNFSPRDKLKASFTALTVATVIVPSLMWAAPSTLVIDEFMIAGKTATDEYLVLANYGVSPVSLTGYKVLKYTAPGNASSMFSSFGEYLLQPGKRLMLCHSAFNGTRLAETLIYNSSASMASNNSISLLDSKGVVVDLVGFGTNGTQPITRSEGEAIDPSPIAYQVLSRANGFDTDNNNMDFSIVTEPVVLDLNVDKLVISEVLPSPATGEEWFELYNPTNLVISLANLKICDALGSRHCYYFDKSDSIPGGSYKIYGASLTKITLNNSGDWLELYDANDNLLTDSGGDYGAADRGISLSLFGSEYRWTTTLTPAAQNIYTEIIEEDAETVPKAKTTKAKVVTASKKTVAKVTTPGTDTEAVANEETEVKAATTQGLASDLQKTLVDKKTLGWGLIVLAILLLLGYIGWYFRSYAEDIYHKIRPGDDSARF